MCISECTQAPRHLLLAQEWFGLPVCHQSPNWSCLAAERAWFALLCCSHLVLLVADHLVAMAFLLESYSWKYCSLLILCVSYSLKYSHCSLLLKCYSMKMTCLPMKYCYD